MKRKGYDYVCPGVNMYCDIFPLGLSSRHQTYITLDNIITSKKIKRNELPIRINDAISN